MSETVRIVGQWRLFRYGDAKAVLSAERAGRRYSFVAIGPDGEIYIEGDGAREFIPVEVVRALLADWDERRDK